MKIIFFLLFFISAVPLVWSQNQQYAPRNEVSTDPSLEQFVNRLKQAIDAKDESFLLSVMDKDVSAAIGGEGGIGEFKDMWKPERDTSLIWPLLKRVIELGGVFLHDSHDETGRYQFVFPYVYDMELNLEDDYYSLGVITGKNVNLREKPDAKATVKTQLTYDIIWFLSEEENGPVQSGINPMGQPEWYLIETYDKAKRGWVNWKYVYSPMDYRLFLFKDQMGAWKISAFLAGD